MQPGGKVNPARLFEAMRNPEHIREDFDIWDFRLSDADRRAVEEMDIGSN